MRDALVSRLSPPARSAHDRISRVMDGMRDAARDGLRDLADFRQALEGWRNHLGFAAADLDRAAPSGPTLDAEAVSAIRTHVVRTERLLLTAHAEAGSANLAAQLHAALAAQRAILTVLNGPGVAEVIPLPLHRGVVVRQDGFGVDGAGGTA